MLVSAGAAHVSSARPILIQVVAIVGLGLALGVADAFVVRPLKTERVAPPPPTVPDTPAPTLSSTPTTAAPSVPGAAFTPTSQEAMPAGHITLAVAKRLFDAQGATFIDARKMDLFEASHIPGAFKIELHDFEQGNPPILMMIPRGAQLIIYCTGGNCDESEKVAKMLQGSGYPQSYVLHDGLPGWQGMGWPTEQGRGMMP